MNKKIKMKFAILLDICTFAKIEKKLLTKIVFRHIISLVVERMWRNWQTHKTQNLAVVTSCGFKSRHPHNMPERSVV